MKIEYKVGDATKPDEYGAVIVHCCNDLGRWGSGFVLALNRAFGQGPRDRYMEMTLNGGEVSYHYDSDSHLRVANIIGQAGIASPSNPKPLRLDWLLKGLKRVHIDYKRRPIVMPRIGCGLAGGTWSEVEPLVREAFDGHMAGVYVYDLPVVQP